MPIRPDSPVPIFEQIADDIRRAVAAGIYRPGDLIPSVRARAISALVNPNTVQRAYQELEREGLIISKKGTGMIVAPRSRAAAQNGVEENMRSGFVHAIDAGRSSGLNRAAIDKVYRDAWNQSQKRSES